MADLFDEIKEDLKEERYAQLWQRYGNYIIGFALFVIVATAVNVFWSGYREQVSADQGSKLYKAIETAQAKSPEEAYKDFDAIIEDDKYSYPALASLQKASILVKEKKIDQAIKLYQDLYKDSSVEKEFRELAGLLYCYHRVESGEYDHKEINTLLDDLGNNDGVWRYSALELRAVIALKRQEYEVARSILEKMSKDSLTPERLKSRVVELLSLVKAKADDSANEKSEDTGSEKSNTDETDS